DGVARELRAGGLAGLGQRADQRGHALVEVLAVNGTGEAVLPAVAGAACLALRRARAGRRGGALLRGCPALLELGLAERAFLAFGGRTAGHCPDIPRCPCHCRPRAWHPRAMARTRRW